MTLLLATSAAFQPVTNIYNGAQSAIEIIPFGALNVLIEVWGATGNSGGGDGLTFGGGGGSGGYARSSYFVAAFGGQTMNLTVGAAGQASTVSSGGFTLTTMTGPGGGPGQFGFNPNPGAGGAAGAIGTGGNVTNLVGHAGAAGSGSGGVGGAGVVGINGTGPNGPTGTSTTLVAGLPGLIIFKYT